MRHLRRALIAFVVLGSLLGLAATASAQSAPVWLCRPGATPNPCVTNLTAEKFGPTGQSLGIDHFKASTHNKFDCFYVYPTISNEPTPVADLKIGPEQNSIALYQAAQYSQDCNVYAPVYRQATLLAINGGAAVTAQDRANTYNDVADAFQYYLKHYNNGRGFVLMGHSQGSFVLRSLISQVVDPSAKLRKQMIAAALLGGNVVVGPGANGTGGDFQNIPVCKTDKSTGCVEGFSTFNQPVPTPALFGRPGATLPNGKPTPAGSKVLCTNPALLLGTKGGIVDGITPEQPFAQGLLSAGISLLGVTVPKSSQPFAEIVNSYKVRCSSANNANVLEATAVGGAPTPHPSPDPTWGLHLLDVGLTWGTMVKVVAVQGQTWLAAQAKSHKTTRAHKH
jgi:Protein of unknown function (DUF3089)